MNYHQTNKALTLLIQIIFDAVKQNCQFIIVTHSPILMAYPEAEILDFNSFPPEKIQYDSIDHVRIQKGFLENKERYLRELFS